jgi:hypothetical protein
MHVTITGGVAGATYLITGTDTAAGIAAAKLSDANDRKIQSLTLECDQGTGYGIRYAFGGTSPTQGSPSTMHYLPPGSTLTIDGYTNIASLLLINETNAQAAKVWATPYY